ncbi:carbohydrate ABC transporter permease [Atribacter laminatus]|jgi:multiple sugar transport system permease protein|uniref:Trehalose transport system permease protein SugB n=1 Tax=Atribacter laminatus TaxID=2847778 RepID=A0A7T1AMT3_ATRLM|nr:carbohydrate ABC transporter permease [Atribacter laminatus]QPM68811.1 Trehalose transport system permease protein SugB [Atribacter laminatus]
MRSWKGIEILKNRIAFIIVLGIVIIMLFPIIWMVTTSFKNSVDSMSIPPKWFFQPTAENYESILKNQDFINAFKNSLLVAGISLAIVLIIGLPGAYALERFNFKRKKDLAFWILSTRMAPPIGVLLPFYLMFRRFNLTDTRISLILMHITINLALTIWVMRGFFREIPYELEESAQIDGCSTLGSFFKIILPLSINGIISTAILGFIFSWNDFIFASVLAGGSSRTLPVVVARFIGYYEIKWGELSAGGVVAIIPAIIFIGFVQKYLVRGLTFGALKE